jgi:hypothetical protein
MNQTNNNKKVTNQEDEHSTSASESNDLDDYATVNECNLIKRSNPVRISRKLALNRIIAHSHSNVNTNLSHQNLVEASYLLDFLNKGLEENRELPLNSNSRSNSNTVSNVELNKNVTTAITTDSPASLISLKRHSSVGCLDSSTIKNKLTESERSESNFDKLSQETLCFQEASSNCNLDSDTSNNITTTTTIKVPLRRCSSTSECDLSYNRLNFRNRREITSAVLHEEATNESETMYSDETTTRSQSKSSTRLSGLKKLGSLYKTFEDDDFKLKRTTTTISNSKTNEQEINESNMQTSSVTNLNDLHKTGSIKSNLEAKRALFENNKSTSNLLVNSLSSSSLASCIVAPSIVTNRIMKFETQKESSNNNNNNKKVNNSVINNKTNQSNELTTSVSFCSSFSSSMSETNELFSPLSSSPKTASDNWTSNYLDKQQKVKSLSKNWELIANKNNQLNKNDLTTKSNNIMRSVKLEQMISNNSNNNLIQLMSQSAEEKDSLNDGSGNNSDDNEGSKDDGFETQSDTNSVQSIKLNDVPLPVNNSDSDENNCTHTINNNNLEDSSILITETENNNKNNDFTNISVQKVQDSSSELVSGKHKPVTNRKSTLNKNKSNNLNKKSSKSNYENNQIDETTKKKSGSTLGLYLTDTASTKARKAEIKSSFRASNNGLNNQAQSTSINNITNSCSTTKKNQQINRKSSILYQKSTEKLNLHSISSISLTNKEMIIKTKKNQNLAENSVFERLAKSPNKGLKLK